MADVFVSYAREDTRFVRGLHEFLTASGKDVWVDWEDIAPGSRWEQDIDDSIDDADSFVFVVSEDSLASEYCVAEFRHAGERGKRIVPIAPTDVDPGMAPEALRQLNWIWCRETDDREAAFATLLPALDTDLDWARAHTRLLVRAVEWDKRRDGSLLLRGRDLEEAVQQLAGNAGKEPVPTELQKEYVLESRRAGKRRQRIVLGSVSLALVVSVALGIVALLQRNTANERARQARSQALAAEAVERLERDPPAALARALQAFDTQRTPEARTALRRAILANPVDYAIPARSVPPSGSAGARGDALAFGGDGTVLGGLTPDRRLHLWRTETGRRRLADVAGTTAFAAGDRFLLAGGSRDLRLLDLRSPDETVVRRPLRSGARVVGVAVSARGPLAVVARGGAAWVVHPASGRQIPLRGRRLRVGRALFSGDGARVLTLAEEGRARLWSALDGRLVATLPLADAAAVSPDGRFVATVYGGQATLWAVDGRTRSVRLGPAGRVAFSPDGRLVVAVGAAGEGGVWSAKGGRQLAAFPGFSTLEGARGTFFAQGFTPGAAFSPDGHLLALAGADGTVRVWELATRKQVGAFRPGWVNALVFAPRGGRLAAMTWNGDVVVARVPASLPLRTGFRPPGCGSVEFAPVVSPDGTRVMARSARGAGIWTIEGRFVSALRPPSVPASEGRQVGAAVFSGDGTTVAAAALPSGCYQVAGAEHRAAVWRLGRARPLRVFESDPRLLLDRNGSVVAVGPRAWRTATRARLTALDGILALSANGRVALVARAPRMLAIVDTASGAVVARLQGADALAAVSRDGLTETALSPDGRRLLTARDQVRLWDAGTGEQVALLRSRADEEPRATFGEAGRLVLLTSADRAAVFRSSDGSLVRSVEGAFDAISPDGALAVRAEDDGGLTVVDLRTGTRATLQTDTALLLTGVSFGPTPDVLVVADREGDVHVVRCAICASEEELVSRARATLARASRVAPRPPPVAGTA
ncbi:MAG: TIR domain-containing protein [Pseudomonadota bacterium]